MKIDALHISNFRGIKKLSAEGLGDTIIIAGQNGSGKSCLFDAIRLLKSTYGGYQQNEWQQFFGEFAIQLTGGAKHLKGLFNDITQNVIIEAVFSLRGDEREYVLSSASELLEETIWQTLIPEAFQYGGYRKALFSAQFRDRKPEVNKRIEEALPILNQELSASQITGKIEIRPDGSIEIQNSQLLNVIFSNYRPRKIGLIDFHGAQRHYGRENVQGVNLSLEQNDQQYGAHTLYNYNNKYNNVKSEMAGNYIKELLAEKADIKLSREGNSISEVLQELFEVFFPDKKFSGPRPNPDGTLTFPVKTQSGTEHDLDELSSGEKEILYGYLRIRSSAPRNSIILLDEPELHLNPRLIRGLPEFYRKHLGEALQNQLWLITHSDTLIREAAGKPGFNVFHMLPSGADDADTSQLRPLSVTEDLDVVLTDLVGDLAAYRPGGKGLIFEGGGDSDFDKTIAFSLFPHELRGVNLISGSNKSRVKVLHEVLERAYSRGDLPTKFFAITDRDSDELVEEQKAVSRFQWNVYHIENYLLDNESIAEVINSLRIGGNSDAAKVEKALEDCARSVVPWMIEHKMRVHANRLINSELELGFRPGTSSISFDLHSSASRSISRLGKLVHGELSEHSLAKEEARLKIEIEVAFADGSWREILPGRQIMKRFAENSEVPVSYEVFRNLVLNRMVERGRRPVGMEEIILKVANG